MLRLPPPIRFRPPREKEPEASVADRLRELPTAPKPQQVNQLQTAALAVRLTDILTKGDVASGADEGARLTRLDMQSELLLRRMAVLLRRQAPKVSMTE